jgi:hypothetical protein
MFAKEIQPNGTIAYREESTRVPLMITVLAIVILATPLSAWIVKINRVGTQFTDVTKYKALVQIVGSDLVAINGFLRLDEEGMKARLLKTARSRRSPRSRLSSKVFTGVPIIRWSV